MTKKHLCDQLLEENRVFGATLEFNESQKQAIRDGGWEEEVVDKGEWEVDNNGLDVSVISSDFTHDVWLVVTGDFSDNEQRVAYAEQIAKRLNETREDK